MPLAADTPATTTVGNHNITAVYRVDNTWNADTYSATKEFTVESASYGDLLKAKQLIESQIWTVEMDKANDVATIKTYVQGILASLDLKGVTATINDQTLSVVSAEQGNSLLPAGRQGSFSVNIGLTKGGENPISANVGNGVITPIAYTLQPWVNLSASSASTVVAGSEVTLSAVITDIVDPIYEWYSNTTLSTLGARKIDLVASSTYSPNTNSLGTTYYYCVVSGTVSNFVGITVKDATVAPTIITEALKNGLVGTAYTATLGATGTSPITWVVTSGSLPAGLSLNTATGEISGTPTSTGTATFTVKAANSVGEDSKELKITIGEEAAVPALADGNFAKGTKSIPWLWFGVVLISLGGIGVVWAIYKKRH